MLRNLRKDVLRHELEALKVVKARPLDHQFL
jgi:hypothetical protein